MHGFKRGFGSAMAATLVGLLSLAPAQAADVVQDIALGDKLIGSTGTAGEDTVTVRFNAVAGTRLGINVTAHQGSGLAPTVALKDASGAEIDLGKRLVQKKNHAKVDRFEITTSGSYRFEIGAASGDGTFKAKTRGKFPRRQRFEGTYPADATQQVDVMPGTVVKAKVTAAKSSAYEPAIDSYSDESGALTLEGLTAKGKKAGFTSALAATGGGTTLALGGAGSGAYEARLRLKPPKSKAKLHLTDSPPLTELRLLSGRVTNSLTGEGLPALSVSLDPALADVATDGFGTYSVALPAGSYELTFSATHFETASETVTLADAPTATLDVALEPIAEVVVSAAVTGDAIPGGDLTGSLSVDVLDGSAATSILWEWAGGAVGTIGGASTESPTITLPDASAFKAALIEVLSEPPLTEAQLPPNVPLPEGDFAGGLQDRFQPVAVNHFALEEAGKVVLKATVTTSSGSYEGEVEVHAHLPFKVAPGLRNVPIGIPVILQSRDHVDEDDDDIDDETGLPTSYDWALTSVPTGSKATLADPTTQNPDFTPDVAGLYTLTVTDTTQLPGTDVVTIDVHAGTWRGVIVGQDGDGRPVADASCTGCHTGNPGFPPDAFTPWAQSGHAEIFTDLLDSSPYYSPSCFGCHTVGYDTEVANGGADDAPDHAAFLGGGLLGHPGDNWTTMLASYPETAQLSNVQCESCHGPQLTAAHQQHDPRVSLSAEVCASCHGEPLRHARYQQWQLSRHANYELAEERSQDGSCARCHTANGFLAWLPVLQDDDPATDPRADVAVGWSVDESHPQTCVTCHDPHVPGSTSGEDTNVTVRITDSTPPLIAGFTAVGVGRGALCMTCHNSRRGLHNDAVWPGFVGTSETSRAPHPGVQADLLMGQNAYLVGVGVRGAHSFVTDTCVNCHMEQTDPPGVLSYNLSGTNHTFFASKEICSRCHGDAFEAEGVQSAVQVNLETLEALLEDALLDLIDAQTSAGKKIDLDGEALILSSAEILGIEFGESRGRQAITVALASGPVGPIALSNVDVLSPADVVLGTLYDFADERLPKSGWNFSLIHADGSRGIHNPTFALGALGASIDALNALATP